MDGVILIVDYWTGPMSQSRFVLSKALLNPKVVPIVVANKIDREATYRQPGEFENEIFELFVGLDASDAQIDYPMFYGSARQGWMEKSLEDCKKLEHPDGMI